MVEPPNDQDDEPTKEQHEQPPPKVIANKYHLHRFIASGSYGAVYEASYSIYGSERRVAIKVWERNDDGSKIRFKEEIKTLCLLNDPHICKVLDGGVDGNKMFLVMDLADGGNLKTQLRDSASGRIPPELAITWLIESAKGLLAAERNRTADGEPAPIHHRDVKPENLLLHRGQIVVADFGAAKLGGSNPGVTSDLVVGQWTPNYGSPEQQAGMTDHRSDIYSLGATFFHLLTGQITAKRLNNAFERFQTPHDPCVVCPEVPAALGAIISRMTEPSPDRRYQSFADVLSALEELRQGTTSTVPTPPPKSWAPAAAVVVALCAALAIVAILIWYPRPSSRGTLQEEQSRCQATIDRLTALGSAHDWSKLADLQPNLALLTQQATENKSALARLAESGAADGPNFTLPAGFHPLEDIEQRMLAVEAQALLAEASAAIPTSGRQRLDALLEGVRTAVYKVSDRAQLNEATQKLERAIDQEKRQRNEDLSALQARLDEDRLDGLAGGATAAGERFEQLGETELARRARVIAAATGRTAALVARIPAWPPAGRPPLDCLDDLQRALNDLKAVSEDTVGVDLKTWWNNRVQTTRRAWGDRVSQEYETVVKNWRERASDFEQRKAAALKAGGDLKEIHADHRVLTRERQEIENTRRSLRDLKLPVALTELGDLADDPLDLSDCDEALAMTPPHSETAVELQDAAQRVTESFARLSDLTKKARDGGMTAQAQRELYDALQNHKNNVDGFQSARQALATLRDVQANLSSRATAELDRTCQAQYGASYRSQALQTLLEEVRAQVRDEQARRVRGVTDLEVAFAEARRSPDELARAADEAGGYLQRQGEANLAARCTTLAADARAAAEVVASLTKSSGDPATSGIDDVVAALREIVEREQGLSLPPANLSTWWDAYRKKTAGLWIAKAISLWPGFRTEVEDSGDAARLAAATALRTQLVQALTQLKQTWVPSELRPPRTPVVPIATAWAGPEGWPNDLVPPEGVKSLRLDPKDPECQRLYATGFLISAESEGKHLFYFPSRSWQSRDEVPSREHRVYMVLCRSADGRAALIDVHPMTKGAMGPSRNWQRTVMANLPPDAVLHDTSASMAAEVPGAATLGLRLPPADFLTWPGCQSTIPGLARPEPSSPVRVAQPTRDVVQSGLTFLSTGFREWTASGTVVGVSESAPDESGGAVRSDCTFRMCLELKPKDR